MRYVLLLFLLLPVRLFADSPKEALEKNLMGVVDENSVLLVCANDLRGLNREDQIFTRYIWITDGDLEGQQRVSLILNYVSRSPVIKKPLPIKVGKILVVRVDLRYFAPEVTDLQEWIKIWELFQFDPRFNLLLTEDTIKFAIGIDNIPKSENKVVKKKVRKKWPGGKDDEGNYFPPGTEYDAEVEEIVKTSPFDVNTKLARVVSEHLDKTLIAFLIQATQSQSPVVNDKYFGIRALTTIKGKGVFQVLYGGQYYELAGIRKNFKKGTDEDNFLESLGIGNVEAGITAKKIFDRNKSDQRIAVFRSKVTAKPRQAEVLYSLVGRDNLPIVIFTHDIADDDIDIGTHAIMNLLNFKDRAREVIYVRANGLHGFLIFDGNGKLLDEVDFEIAMDSTIPSPHTQRLQAAKGCIICHASESGWRKMENDVKNISKVVDIFGDRTENKKSVSDVVDRLAGLYAGDLEIFLLPTARNRYANSILKATGPWKGGSKDQTDIAKLSGDSIAKLFKEYVYDLVDATTVLKDLSIPYKDKDDAVKKLNQLLPPVNILIDGIFPEDPRIAGLKAGVGINRSDYDLVYSFIATRIKGKK